MRCLSWHWSKKMIYALEIVFITSVRDTLRPVPVTKWKYSNLCFIRMCVVYRFGLSVLCRHLFPLRSHASLSFHPTMITSEVSLSFPLTTITSEASLTFLPFMGTSEVSLIIPSHYDCEWGIPLISSYSNHKWGIYLRVKYHYYKIKEQSTMSTRARYLSKHITLWIMVHNESDTSLVIILGRKQYQELNEHSLYSWHWPQGLPCLREGLSTGDGPTSPFEKKIKWESGPHG